MTFWECHFLNTIAFASDGTGGGFVLSSCPKSLYFFIVGIVERKLAGGISSMGQHVITVLEIRQHFYGQSIWNRYECVGI